MRRLTFLLLLLATSPALAASLILPFDGEWIAVGGPPCPDCTKTEAFALELLPLDPFGRPATTCINRPVLAPADGTVTEARDDLPNRTGPGDTPGNHIVIALPTGEVVVLDGLRQGSLTAKVGDIVTAGQALATCGIKLRIHMQASAGAEGLPIPFANLDVRTPGGCFATTFLYRGQGTC